jgi:hypothetical protein
MDWAWKWQSLRRRGERAVARRRTPGVLPRCQALLLCERVILNAQTLRNSVIEILDWIDVTGVPATVGPLMAYVQLIGGIGGYAIRFEIHDLNANEIVAATGESLIEFGDADEALILTASLPPLEFAGLRPHDLVVFADDREIARSTFHVVPDQDEGGDNGAQDDEET